MGKRRESDFAEIAVDRLLMESFPNEASAYFASDVERFQRSALDKFRSKVRWHISRSLSPRQREVIILTLEGKKQREIAEILGITQQVVSIYKLRAIKRLQKLITQ
ncbi:MAG: sigma factor-like helix-turn-helix DNA-binding protein [Candidatus Zixiibacteriota bacterium]